MFCDGLDGRGMGECQSGRNSSHLPMMTIDKRRPAWFSTLNYVITKPRCAHAVHQECGYPFPFVMAISASFRAYT